MTNQSPSEHVEQREFVAWFRRAYPGVRIFAIPNGGARNKATAGKLKAEGVASGVPDLFVPAMRLWIEMKRARGGTVSAMQRDWIDYLEAVGYHVIVARGCDDAKVQVIRFVNGLED